MTWILLFIPHYTPHLDTVGPILGLQQRFVDKVGDDDPPAAVSLRDPLGLLR